MRWWPLSGRWPCSAGYGQYLPPLTMPWPSRVQSQTVRQRRTWWRLRTARRASRRPLRTSARPAVAPSNRLMYSVSADSSAVVPVVTHARARVRPSRATATAARPSMRTCAPSCLPTVLTTIGRERSVGSRGTRRSLRLPLDPSPGRRGASLGLTGSHGSLRTSPLKCGWSQRCGRRRRERR